MKKFRAEILVADDADWQAIEDAKAKAVWKRIITLEEIMARTDLDNKCGSCVHFDMCDNLYGKATGRCKLKDTLRERTRKCCKTFYVNKEKI